MCMIWKVAGIEPSSRPCSSAGKSFNSSVSKSTPKGPGLDRRASERARTLVDLARRQERLGAERLPAVHDGVALAHPLEVVDELVDRRVRDLDLVDVDGRESEAGAVQERGDGLRVCGREERAAGWRRCGGRG